MPQAAVCPDGHIHLLAPCPDGCGQMRPTNIIVGRVPVQQPNHIIGASFENCDTAVSLGANAFIKGRDLKLRECDTGFKVTDGKARLDLDGIDYEYRPPRRERRKKKRKR